MPSISPSSGSIGYPNLGAATRITITPVATGSEKSKDLVLGFAAAFKQACSTTVLGQTFYSPEFNRAQDALRQIDALGECRNADEAFRQLNAILDELKQTGKQGLKFRLWRDGISVLTSLTLMAIMASALQSQQERDSDDFSAANNPVGMLAADAGLVLLEGSKMLITTSLSYPTLKRHHLVDEFLKRITASVALLSACLDEQIGTVPANSVSRWNAVKRCVLPYMEKGRDVSTAFTLFNTVSSPARGVLWSIETVNGFNLGSVRGFLRMMQNASDSLRSIFSTIGSAARTTLFTDELDQFKATLSELGKQCEHADAEQVLSQLKKMELLFTFCSTPLLSQIVASRSVIANFKSASITSFNTLKGFLDEEKITLVVSSDRQFLHSEAPENSWGEKLMQGAYKYRFSMVGRLPYRIVLEMQHQMSRALERIMRR